MTDFWPDGLDLTDTSSPADILQVARAEWLAESGGVLELAIQETRSTAGNHMLVVHAKHVPTKRTITLFSVVHRTGSPYPAKIKPRENDLPDILKKSYYQPGLINFSEALALPGGRQVTNKYVCDTPSEFRSHLKEVLNLGNIKSEILSLVSGSKPAAHSEEIGETTVAPSEMEAGEDE